MTLDTLASVLKDLITDLLDADRACNNKTAKPSGSALIKGKGGKGGNGKKKCRYCHQEDPRHSEKDCLAVNTEKRKEWEDKTGKKWIPYDQYIKKKSEGKDKKPRKGRKPEDSDDDDDEPTYSLVAQLGSVFKTTSRAFMSLYQDKWLADSGADGHVTNNKAWFDTYQPAKFDPIETAGGYITPRGIGTVKLQALTTDGSSVQLILQDVIYLPECPRNLFGVGKLIKRGYFVKYGKVMYTTDCGKERELCATDSHLHLVLKEKGPQSVLMANLPALTVLTDTTALVKQQKKVRKTDDMKTPKTLDIDLWHKRLGHLGLDNVRKTAEITKGIRYQDNESESDSPCEACSLAKPLRTTRKISKKRVFKALDKIWVDTFMIKPSGLKGHKYGMILTDEATHVRWGYTFKEKNEAFDCLKKHIAMVKTQYNREIKGWRMDGGREYSLSQLKELCDNIGSILEITTPHNPEQDSISERSIQLILEKVRSAIIG